MYRGDLRDLRFGSRLCSVLDLGHRLVVMDLNDEAAVIERHSTLRQDLKEVVGHGSGFEVLEKYGHW